MRERSDRLLVAVAGARRGGRLIARVRKRFVMPRLILLSNSVEDFRPACVSTDAGPAENGAAP